MFVSVCEVSLFVWWTGEWGRRDVQMIDVQALSIKNEMEEKIIIIVVIIIIIIIVNIICRNTVDDYS